MKSMERGYSWLTPHGSRVESHDGDDDILKYCKGEIVNLPNIGFMSGSCGEVLMG